VTVQSARDALQKADESRLSLQFKCGELSVALEDITQEKNRLHGLLQAEREEVRKLLAGWLACCGGPAATGARLPRG
jgi:hypothetical protein